MPKASRASTTPPEPSAEPKRQPRSNGLHPGGRPYERPPPYDEKAIETFFGRLAQGMKVAEAADCEECPNLGGIYLRSATDSEFRNRFLRAREAQQDAQIDETMEIADSATHETWQVARLRIQTRQWRAARLASQIYGEKSQLNLVVSDALSDRLTAALKRQRELASGIQIDGVAEPLEVLPAPVDNGDKG